MEKDMDEAIENETQTEEKEETCAQQEASEPAEETNRETSQKENKKDKKDTQIEELQDRVKRQMAEFENFRKRSEKEKSKMFEMGAKSVIEQLLPIVDNFERGLAAVPEEAKTDAFVDGMNKVYRQMTEMLDKLGVKPIEAVGCEFNPDFHNAVMHVEEEETAENTITEEFLKGYTYKDQVVRHSMVKVAN
ncbi:nucleotide exchange factor GrpE [Marvinbryantia sp.]|uniref:nucleotide exchange factor GrpE n=1 Tax=Marvinbryantia sp. TaxID=2496532 RepID=UPI003A933871